MMRELTEEQYSLLKNIIWSVLNAYDENGKLVDDYYENIILDDLTKKQYEFIKNI